MSCWLLRIHAQEKRSSLPSPRCCSQCNTYTVLTPGYRKPATILLLRTSSVLLVRSTPHRVCYDRVLSCPPNLGAITAHWSNYLRVHASALRTPHSPVYLHGNTSDRLPLSLDSPAPKGPQLQVLAELERMFEACNLQAGK